jgi:HEAT repeat protein
MSLSLSMSTLLAQVKGSTGEAKKLVAQGGAAFPRLLELVKDPDRKVREQAVRSMCEIGSPQSLEPLIEATKQPDGAVQVKAMECLVNFYVPGYYQSGMKGALKKTTRSVKGKFTDTNDVVIPANIEARADVRAAVRQVLLSGADENARAKAAQTAGILRDRDALEILHNTTKDKDSELIYQSLVAIRKLGNRSSGPKVWFLLRDLDPKVRLEAIEITGLFQNREATPRLMEMYQADDKRYRAPAFLAISRMADSTNAPLFEKHLADPDPELRGIAAEGLGRLARPADAERLRKIFLEERVMEPRLSQAFGAVLAGDLDEGQFSPLTYLVNTLNSAINGGIADAYLRDASNTISVRRALGNKLPTMTSPEKVAVLQILGERGQDDALAPLEYMTKDPDPVVSREALRALTLVRARSK